MCVCFGARAVGGGGGGNFVYCPSSGWTLPSTIDRFSLICIIVLFSHQTTSQNIFNGLKI